MSIDTPSIQLSSPFGNFVNRKSFLPCSLETLPAAFFIFRSIKFSPHAVNRYLCLPLFLFLILDVSCFIYFKSEFSERLSSPFAVFLFPQSSRPDISLMKVFFTAGLSVYHQPKLIAYVEVIFHPA